MVLCSGLFLLNWDDFNVIIENFSTRLLSVSIFKQLGRNFNLHLRDWIVKDVGIRFVSLLNF